MTAVFIGPTDLILSVLAPCKYNEQVKAWRWHQFMMAGNPNYLAEIAQRQADKRAAGIGPDGLCHA